MSIFKPYTEEEIAKRKQYPLVEVKAIPMGKKLMDDALKGMEEGNKGHFDRFQYYYGYSEDEWIDYVKALSGIKKKL